MPAHPTINLVAVPLIIKVELVQVLIMMLVIIKPQLHLEEIKDTTVVDSSANSVNTNNNFFLTRFLKIYHFSFL